MAYAYAELVLVSLAAMVSPTTLAFSVLALVLADRPFRTGAWFYVGAVGATLAVGVLAAFVLEDVATSHRSSPKTWVAILDLVFAGLLLAYVAVTRNRPIAPEKVESMVARMTKVTASPAIAIVGAGAVLANPGGFIPIALKSISETDPTSSQYIVEWLVFTLVSVLPLAVALVLILIAPVWARRVLARARDWLIANARLIAAVIIVLLAIALIRNGLSGLV
jgi:Sap, sulfolipid-1-addressing protein